MSVTIGLLLDDELKELKEFAAAKEGIEETGRGRIDNCNPLSPTDSDFLQATRNQIDTLVLEPNERSLVLPWRAVIPVPRRASA